MNNRILIYITSTVVAFFVALASSCSVEHVAPAPAPPAIEDPFRDGELPINLPVTRAVNDGIPENQVNTARLIVIKNSVVTNNKIFSSITIPGSPPRDSVYVLDTIPVGTVDMFIIVNEKAEWNLDDLTKLSIYFPEDIEKKTLSFSAYPVVDGSSNAIPMYRQYRNLSVKSDPATFTHGGTVIPMGELGEVYRLYAKVTLVTKCVFADLPNGGDAIQLDSVAVKSMPRYSNLTPSVGLLYPVSGGYFDGAAQTRTSNYDDADNLHFYDSIVFYIPEHRLSDINYKTYLSVKASLKGNTDPAEQVEFKIALGDGVKSHDNKELMEGKAVPAADLFITRNTHYQVTATIKSFDKANQSEIDVITNVIIWELTATDEPYIGQHELKISQDKFYITGSIDFEGTVTVETDDPKGWSAARSATASTVKFYNASTTAYDLTSLDNQTGTKLRFKSSSVGVNDSISITAGPIVKRIYLIRQ